MSDNSAKRIKTDKMDFDEKCINTIRVLAADMVEKASSGHPGAPMGLAPVAHALWSKVMNYNPGNSKWANRDRFVLSNGHACALLYSMLHLTGYKVTMDDLKQFRQVGSITPGHPENHLTDGVEVTTGPLGQGLANSVGMAIAQKHLAARYNKPGYEIADHFTYVVCGDGCLQEGVAAEACSLACGLGLGRLIVIYDDNKIQIDGSTELAFREDVLKRFEGYGWHTQTVENGDSADLSSLLGAIQNAKEVTDRPSIIKVRTTIGFGSSKAGTAGVHGSALGAESLAGAKKAFGFNPEETFVVPEEVAAHFAAKKTEGASKEAAWNELFAKYKAAHPELAAEFERVMQGDLPANWEDKLPKYTPESKTEATRKYSAASLTIAVDALPELIGGSADLTPSNNTKVSGNKDDFTADNPAARYIRFGVREHAMAAICNGMASHGGVIPFGATFLVFAGYALGAMRLSALSEFRVLYIMTHDSIGLGEDGPTHQPVETLATLRAIPNMYVFRPADGNEVAGAYKQALSLRNSPSVMALSRQNCANLAGTSSDGVAKGAYVIQEANGGNPNLILVGTGSEVQLLTAAKPKLEEQGLRVRVVSFPCWELFNQQSVEYKESVFLPDVPVLSVEAGVQHGWQQYSHAHFGMTSFGKSGPGAKVFEHFGFTPDGVVERATKLVKFYSTDMKPSRQFKAPF